MSIFRGVAGISPGNQWFFSDESPSGAFRPEIFRGEVAVSFREGNHLELPGRSILVIYLPFRPITKAAPSSEIIPEK